MDTLALTEKRERFYALIEDINADAYWKASVLCDLAETWAKVDAAGADRVFQRASEEINRIDDNRKIYNDESDNEGSDKTDLLVRLAGYWAEANPIHAVSLLARIDDAAKRSFGLREVAAAWVKIDPEPAVKLVDSIEDEGDKAWALAYIARYLAKSNPVRAVQIAQRLKSDTQKASTLCSIAATCAQTEPKQAEAIFQQAFQAAESMEEDRVPPAPQSFFARFSLALRERPRSAKGAELQRIAVAWAKIAPIQALRVTQGIAHDFYRDETIEKLVPFLAAENPRLALRVVEKIQEIYRDQKALAFVKIAEIWAKTERRQAIALLEQAADLAKPPLLLKWLDKWLDDLNIGFARALAMAYAPLDAERARQIADTVTNGSYKAEILCSIAVLLLDTNPAQASRFFQNALQTANAIRRDEERARILRLSAEVWAHKIPYDALNLAEGVPVPFDKAVVLNQIAAVLAKTEPAQAKAILERPPSESDVQAYARYYYDATEAVRDVTAVLSKTTPAEANRLFEAFYSLALRVHDAGRKAEVLRYLAEAWAATNPQRALEIAHTIAYDAEKAETLRKITVAWAQAWPAQAVQAMTVAKSISLEQESERLKAICDVATAWAKANFAEALGFVRETQDFSTQTALIGGIWLALSEEADEKNGVVSAS